jgi:hypothetical protein
MTTMYKNDLKNKPQAQPVVPVTFLIVFYPAKVEAKKEK